MAISYFEKLKDPRWQKKRLRILERDGWKCTFCGAENKSLHVHHLIYGEGEPWEISDAVLVTLCAECHEGEEAVRKQASEALFEALAFCGIRSAYHVEYLASAIAHFISPERSDAENLLAGVRAYCNGWPQTDGADVKQVSAKAESDVQ